MHMILDAIQAGIKSARRLSWVLDRYGGPVYQGIGNKKKPGLTARLPTATNPRLAKQVPAGLLYRLMAKSVVAGPACRGVSGPGDTRKVRLVGNK